VAPGAVPSLDRHCSEEGGKVLAGNMV